MDTRNIMLHKQLTVDNNPENIEIRFINDYGCYTDFNGILYCICSKCKFLSKDILNYKLPNDFLR